MFVRVRNVQEKFEKGLHFFEVPQVMKRRQRKIGVARPAVPLVTFATSTRLLGESCRQCRQNGACVFEAVELQVQSGADDLLLMQQRYRAVFDPGSPVAYGLFEEVVRDFDEVVLDTEAPGQTEIEFLRQGNRSLFAEIGQRHVGQQARDSPRMS